MKKCIVMFSGGLDSVVAAHLMKKQGLDVLALHFVLPFASHIDFSFTEVKKAAAVLDVPLRIEEEGEEFFDMLLSPQFGYGKNMNPCVDCRIHRLTKAEKIMREEGADFLVTGEVLGQRPMSQMKHSMNKIVRETGLGELLLRPLCAKLMPPTLPEREGWVDRNGLLDISGRGRSRQLAYARQNGLYHGSPGGGCLLTENSTTLRFNDIMQREGTISFAEFKLIAYGRHFRISPATRLVISRDEAEGLTMEKLVAENDSVFMLSDGKTGPYGIGKGVFSSEDLTLSAALFARYSRYRNDDSVDVDVIKNGEVQRVSVKPLTIEQSETYLIDIAKTGK